MLSLGPFCKDDCHCPMVSRNGGQSSHVIGCGPWRRPTLCLDEYHLEDVASLETSNICVMILAHGKQVDNAT